MESQGSSQTHTESFRLDQDAGERIDGVNLGTSREGSECVGTRPTGAKIKHQLPQLVAQFRMGESKDASNPVEGAQKGQSCFDRDEEEIEKIGHGSLELGLTPSGTVAQSPIRKEPSHRREGESEEAKNRTCRAFTVCQDGCHETHEPKDETGARDEAFETYEGGHGLCAPIAGDREQIFPVDGNRRHPFEPMLTDPSREVKEPSRPPRSVCSRFPGTA